MKRISHPASEPPSDSVESARDIAAFERSQLARELDARACEHALWLALLAAQRAQLADLLDGLINLHGIAGDQRRDLEAAT